RPRRQQRHPTFPPRPQRRRHISIPPSSLSFSFFFQAEDGIRDATVTGVQTCALPISFQEGAYRVVTRHTIQRGFRNLTVSALTRSEERRVGKECRYRWSPYS